MSYALSASAGVPLIWTFQFNTPPFVLIFQIRYDANRVDYQVPNL